MRSRLSAALLLLALISGTHTRAAPENPAENAAFLSRDEIHAATAKLRADPNLGVDKKVRSLRWTTQAQDKAENIPAWLIGLFEFLGQSTSVLLWGAGAVGAAIAAIWILRTLRARIPADRVKPPPGVSRIGEMDLRPESLPDDVGSAALALLESGRTRDALSLLYRGALSRAVHRFGVPIGESYTEGEALKAVQAKLDPPRAAYFADLVGLWQRAVYAGEAVMSEPIAVLCRRFLPTLDGTPV